MKPLKVLFLVLLLSILTFSIYAESIKVISTNGTVQYKEKSGADWKTARPGQSLGKGYYIFTGFNSSAIVQAEQFKLEVKPLSQLSIAELIADKDSRVTDIYLKYGKVKADVVKSDGKVETSLFKVRSANSTASVRGTTFLYGEDELVVYNGTVFLESNNQDTVLVQRDEKAYSQKYGGIQSPKEEKLKDYYVDTSPTGLSDAESKLGNIISDRRGLTLRGQLIITITVKQ